MLSRSIGIIAASVLGAGAFLIPADIAPLGGDEAADLTSAPGVLNAKQSIIQLPCSECAFSKKQNENVEDGENVNQAEDEFRIQGGANSVVVNLTVSEDGQRLQLDGETIYPLEFRLDSMLAQPLYVNQVASSASIEDIESGRASTTPLEVTGSSVSMHEGNDVTPEGAMIISIKHSIFELEKQPVTLDEIHIEVLKTTEGELFIAHVSTGEPPAKLFAHVTIGGPRAHFFAPPKWAKEMQDDVLSIIPPSHMGHHDSLHQDLGGEEKCKNLPATLCKLKSMIEDRLTYMHQGIKGGLKKVGCHHGRIGLSMGMGMGGRPFHGMLPTHIRPHFLRVGQDGDETLHHHGRPHHMEPHGHQDGQYHHKDDHFVHSFSRGLAAVLIPTMAGVAVGMVVSLVGLCLGRLISFFWIRFYRGGRHGYESVHLDEEEVLEDAEMEKKTAVTLEHSEPLPVYEEAPSYEEVQHESK